MQDNEIKIVQLNASEWQDFKKIRLQALKSEPQAFGASYDDALNKSDEEWVRRIKATENGHDGIMLFAKVDNQLIGMGGSYITKESDTQNLANIWGVYVNEQYRGKGVGKALMQELLKRLTAISNVKKAKLMVNKNQKSALGLYQALGFEIVGTENAILGDGNTYEEYILEKLLT